MSEVTLKCDLGPMHGKASTYVRQDGTRCCDFCGHPANTRAEASSAEPVAYSRIGAEDPIDALVDLLAPVLTHSQGMAARERESRFRKALSDLAVRGLK